MSENFNLNNIENDEFNLNNEENDYKKDSFREVGNKILRQKSEIARK